MDNKIYIRMSEIEREHWWFIARGRIYIQVQKGLLNKKYHKSFLSFTS